MEFLFQHSGLAIGLLGAGSAQDWLRALRARAPVSVLALPVRPVRALLRKTPVNSVKS